MKPWELGRVLDEETLRKLVYSQKLTDKQIASMYGVTAPSIRNHRLKSHPPIQKKRVARIDHRAENVIPWVMDSGQGHHMHPLAVFLRRHSRLKRGLHVPIDAIPRVEEFERELRTAGLVINYTRELGLHTVRRDPNLDAPDSIVRMPPEES